MTYKCGNNLKHENKLNGHGYSDSFSCLRLFPDLLVKIQNSLHACVEKGCSASLTIAREKHCCFMVYSTFFLLFPRDPFLITWSSHLSSMTMPRHILVVLCLIQPFLAYQTCLIREKRFHET